MSGEGATLGNGNAAIVSKIMVGEGHGLCDGSEDHLHTDDEVEDYVSRVPREQIHRGHDLEEARLPEREEKDRLNRHKLVEWVEWSQSLLRSLVEEDKEVEGERNTNIIDEC